MATHLYNTERIYSFAACDYVRQILDLQGVVYVAPPYCGSEYNRLDYLLSLLLDNWGGGGGGTTGWWSLVGNTGTVDGTNWIGTNDSVPFNFKVDGARAGRIDHTNLNTFFGYQSGLVANASSNNSFFGAGSAILNGATAVDNAAFGNSSFASNILGSRNTAFGALSLFTSIGNDNIGIGYLAGGATLTGNKNISIGAYSVIGAAANGAIALGYEATNTISNSFVIGSANVPIRIVQHVWQLTSGRTHTKYFSDVAPETVLTGNSGDMCYVNDATTGTVYLKGTGTATNTGWLQLTTAVTGGYATLTTAQTFSAGAKTFNSSILKIRNPGDTFSYTIVASAIAADRNLTLPLLTGNDTLAVLGLAQTFTAAQTFASSMLLLQNPGATFSYTIVPAAIAAARNLNLPLITGTDTLAVLGLAQTFTAAQTFNSSILKVRNPGDTFSYTFVAAAIAANRNLTIPLLTADDTMMVLGLNQTVTGILTLTTPVIGQATGTSLAVTGLLKSSGTAGIGYATGAGGTITQSVSKSTGVTLDKICGQISMSNAVLNATTSVQFTVTNSTVAATDTIIVNFANTNTANSYTVMVDALANGSFKISVRNYTGGNLSEAININFSVIKGVTS